MQQLYHILCILCKPLHNDVCSTCMYPISVPANLLTNSLLNLIYSDL